MVWNGNHKILSSESLKDHNQYAAFFMYCRYLFTQGREKVLLETVPLLTHRKPLPLLHLYSLQNLVLSDFKVFKELISFFSHFNIFSIGSSYKAKQINQTEICSISGPPKGRERSIKCSISYWPYIIVLLCHILARCPRTSSLYSLSLCFLIYEKEEEIIVPTSYGRSEDLRK